jgi:DNA-binding transcriptional MerR regulator
MLPGTNHDGPLPGNSPIPNKLYFRIGEVAELTGIKPYVIRFWESEFPGLGPKKASTGHRLYRRKDVELVLHIKQLLYEQRFTIEGARRLLQSKAALPVSTPEKEKAADRSEFLCQIRRELAEILDLLGRS